ncbi:cationic amino acid transporter 2-like [Penaeus chinensis]|uniref:cationic amino acid transporter 2-like n=1 Tax=Penaeus chinensis TaxID=139456 RepID=UPI001FB77801|nr:cationic amino acid transporter 2-like [Penaeus chinensis]
MVLLHNILALSYRAKGAQGAVCVELGVRFPRGGGLFTQVYATLGELPAVLVASSLLLDLTLVPAIAARSSSEYLDAATNHTLSRLLTFPLPEYRYLAPHCDLFAATLLVLSTLMIVAGTKVVCQVAAAGVGVSVLVLTAVSCTALLAADTRNWTHPPGFFPAGLHGVVSGGAVLSMGVAGAHQAGLLAGECAHYRGVATRVGVGVGLVALLTLFPAAVGATLAAPTLTFSASLAHLFPGAPLSGMRALVAVGGVTGLWAACLGGVLAGSRAAHRLACDGLAPRCLGRVSRRTATPWAAALACGAASALTAALCSSRILLRAAGAGGLTAGVAGASAVVARRFRPEAVHPLEAPPRPSPAHRASPAPSHSASHSELTDLTAAAAHRGYQACDDSEPRQLAVEWAGGTWVSSVVEPPIPPTWGSWRTSRFLLATFITNCVAGVGVVRAAGELGIGLWAWAGVALCVCGCVVCGVGLWLQPRHPPPTPAFQEGVPLLPLLAVLANITLLLHLPPAALTAACGVWAATGAVWLVQGRSGSIEAALSRALLTHSGQDSPPDLL